MFRGFLLVSVVSAWFPGFSCFLLVSVVSAWFPGFSWVSMMSTSTQELGQGQHAHHRESSTNKQTGFLGGAQSCLKNSIFGAKPLFGEAK